MARSSDRLADNRVRRTGLPAALPRGIRPLGRPWHGGNGQPDGALGIFKPSLQLPVRRIVPVFALASTTRENHESLQSPELRQGATPPPPLPPAVPAATATCARQPAIVRPPLTLRTCPVM